MEVEKTTSSPPNQKPRKKFEVLVDYLGESGHDQEIVDYVLTLKPTDSKPKPSSYWFQLLAQLPETVQPQILHKFVTQQFEDVDPEFLTQFYLARSLSVDKFSGRLDLTMELLELGITDLNLFKLIEPLSRLKLLVFLVEFISTVENSNEGSYFELLDSQNFVRMDQLSLIKQVNKVIRLGADPTVLLKLILDDAKPIVRSNSLNIDEILNVKEGKGEYSLKSKFSGETELLYLKTCLTILINRRQVDVKEVRAVLKLIYRFTELKPNSDTNTIDLDTRLHEDVTLATNLDQLVISADNLDQLAPLVAYLGLMAPGWELLSTGPNGGLPALLRTNFSQRLQRYIARKPSYFNSFREELLRWFVADLPITSKASDNVVKLWINLNTLNSSGHLGFRSDSAGVDVKILILELMTIMLDYQKFEACKQLLYILETEGQDQLDSTQIAQIVLQTSKAKFDAAQTLSNEDPKIKAARDCLECCPTTLELDSWRDFMSGATDLGALYRKHRQLSPKPSKLAIDPLNQFKVALTDSKLLLYKQLPQVVALASKLQLIVDGEGVGASTVNRMVLAASIACNDFPYAYQTCLRFMRMDPSDIDIEACLQLAHHPKFNDIAKRRTLIGLALAACKPEAIHKWLADARQLEATAKLGPKFDEPLRQLFDLSSTSFPLDSLPDLLIRVDKLVAVNKKTTKLQDHPAFASQIPELDLSHLYDGSVSPLSDIDLIRLARTMIDHNQTYASFNPKASAVLDTVTERLLNNMDSRQDAMFPFYLLDLPKSKLEQHLAQLPTTPANASLNKYVSALRLLPYLVDISMVQRKKLTNLNELGPPPQLHLIPPHRLLTDLKNSDIRESVDSLEAEATRLDPTFGANAELAAKKYKSSVENEVQVEADDKLNGCLDRLNLDIDAFTSASKEDKITMLLDRISHGDKLEDVKDSVEIINRTFNHEDLDDNKKSQLLTKLELNYLTAYFAHQKLLENEQKLISYLDSNEFFVKVSKTDIEAIHKSINSHLKHDDIAPNYFKVFYLIYNKVLKDQNELQVELRLKVIESLSEVHRSVSFTQVKSARFENDLTGLVTLLIPSTNLADLDRLIALLSDILAIEPIFAEEVKKESEIELTVAALRSKLVFDTATNHWSSQIQKTGLLLPEAIDQIVNYFELLTGDDLLNLVVSTCQGDLATNLPTSTGHHLVQAAINSLRKLDLTPTAQNLLRDKFDSLISRYQRNELLTELVDPITELDLGYLTVLQLDTVDVDDPEQLQQYLDGLIEADISPYLLSRTVQILHHFHTDSIDALQLNLKWERIQDTTKENTDAEDAWNSELQIDDYHQSDLDADVEDAWADDLNLEIDDVEIDPDLDSTKPVGKMLLATTTSTQVQPDLESELASITSLLLKPFQKKFETDPQQAIQLLDNFHQSLIGYLELETEVSHWARFTLSGLRSFLIEDLLKNDIQDLEVSQMVLDLSCKLTL